MAYGSLVVHVMVAQGALPLQGVAVSAGEQTKISDETGIVVFEGIEAPDVALSLDRDNTEIPYATLDVLIEKENYQSQRIRGVQIFAGQTTVVDTPMVPLEEKASPQSRLDKFTQTPQNL